MLRKFIKWREKRLNKKAEKFHIKKITLAENIAIFKKRKLYKNIKWTANQTNDFNDFWKKHYGKTISPRWHKLYQSINGVFDISYIPEKLLSTVAESKLNPYSRSVLLQDKSLLPLLLSKKGILCANNHIVNSKGIFYDEGYRIITKEEAVAVLKNIGKCIIKPTENSGSGKGLRFFNIKNGVDSYSEQATDEIFRGYKHDFAVQAPLYQCKEVADIYSEAINTFRVTTYILDGNIYSAPSALRVGSGGNRLDNIHAGGYGVPISESGVLGKYAYKLGRGDSKEKIEQHPDTGIVFDGYTIPCFERITKTAKEAHGLFTGVGIISWDIILDIDYQPVIVEANITGQGYWFPQIVHGKGLFGENAAKIIKLYCRK